MITNKPKDVNEYLSHFPEEVQEKLEKVRSTIKKALPKAEEIISYNMPAYKMNSVLVYFAGYDKHIGFYPTSSGISVFQNELSAYKTSKGTIQFPLDKPVPVALITKIAKFRLQEDQEKADMKKAAKKIVAKKATAQKVITKVK